MESAEGSCVRNCGADNNIYFVASGLRHLRVTPVASGQAAESLSHPLIASWCLLCHQGTEPKSEITDIQQLHVSLW